MDVATWPISQIRTFDGNPRRILPCAIEKVMASLKAFGWRQPLVVDREGVLIAGHVRLAAAKQLGMTEVPVHVADNLTPEQARAYRLADNRTAEEVEWDEGLLTLELQALTEDLRKASGFDESELERLIIDLVVAPAGAEDQGKLDEFNEAEGVAVTCPQCGHHFHA
jgi:ParB-like chromosome segregation protein Spo0J